MILLMLQQVSYVHILRTSKGDNGRESAMVHVNAAGEIFAAHASMKPLP